MSDLITTDEIKQLKTNPRRLSWKDVVPGIGVVPPIMPVKLKSGYQISYTIDSIYNEENITNEHLIIGAEGFELDPADADEIAHAVLGKCARAPRAWSPQKGLTHYIKIIGMAEEEEKRSYEVGIERGITMIGVKK